MNKLSLILTLGCTLILTACYQPWDPKAAVAKAGKALQENNMNSLRSVLSEPARNKYANAQWMTNLRSRLAGLDLQVGEASYQGEKNCFGNCIERFYSVPVLNKADNSLIITASVTCTTKITHVDEKLFDKDVNCLITEAQ